MSDPILGPNGWECDNTTTAIPVAVRNPFTGRITSVQSGGKSAGYIARSQPIGRGGRFSLSGSNERGSSGTYHTTFRAAGDFYAVAPIINVTRTPTDGTYTNDDIYDQIAVAPSATILTGGYPDASGGAGAWTASSSMTFARNASASTTTPIPVIGSQFFCNSIARTDGGPGRILMARAYSTGSGHAQQATTRMPTYYNEQGDLAACQKWDDANVGFPLSGHAQYYYRSGNYASTAQDTFGSGATRWQHTCFAGMKFFYTRPCTTVMGVGDSIIGGDYVEAGGYPVRASYLMRAVYALQGEGVMVDDVNLGGSGYRWDQFGPWAQRIVPVFKPEIVLLPIYSVNGVASGVGTSDTAADGYKHFATAMYYREWLLANGVKEVILVTATPQSAKNTAIGAANSALRQAGIPYFDANLVVSSDGSTWKTNYSIDGTHPTALANVALAASLKETLRFYC